MRRCQAKNRVWGDQCSPIVCKNIKRNVSFIDSMTVRWEDRYLTIDLTHYGWRSFFLDVELGSMVKAESPFTQHLWSLTDFPADLTVCSRLCYSKQRAEWWRQSCNYSRPHSRSGGYKHLHTAFSTQSSSAMFVFSGWLSTWETRRFRLLSYTLGFPSSRHLHNLD